MLSEKRVLIGGPEYSDSVIFQPHTPEEVKYIPEFRGEIWTHEIVID
jgi:hypothetical protein